MTTHKKQPAFIFLIGQGHKIFLRECNVIFHLWNTPTKERPASWNLGSCFHHRNSVA